jgi:hypothetical protein
MNIRLRKPVLVMAFALMAARAEAVPFLQLDIVGGTYRADDETIVAGSETFTLVALLTPKQNATASEINALLADTYYISAAVTPGTGPVPASLGTFAFAGATYNVTSDMTFGTPPLDAADPTHDSGDLSTHSVFPTYFRQFAFQFTPGQRAQTYNSQDDPGGYTASGTGRSYYATFAVETDLGRSLALHFDLYNTVTVPCPSSGGRGNGKGGGKGGNGGSPGGSGTCTVDIDIASFAPYSHDAESGHSPLEAPDSPVGSVPEPGNLMLIGIGVVAAARLLRRRTTSGPEPAPEG